MSDGTPEPPGMPRWVKFTAVVIALVVLGILVLLVAGGGSHGPSEHFR